MVHICFTEDLFPLSMYFNHRPVTMALASIGILFFGSVTGPVTKSEAKAEAKSSQKVSASPEAIKAEDEAAIRTAKLDVTSWNFEREIP